MVHHIIESAAETFFWTGVDVRWWPLAATKFDGIFDGILACSSIGTVAEIPS
jgi:hypothetical protein